MIDDVLLPNQSLREARRGIFSVLSPEVEEATYDARADRYDQLVGSEWYNRVMWGVSTETYHGFVQQALDAGEDLLLDAGAGSAVFTADAYRQTSRPLMLVDRSVDMLQAARDRIVKQAGGKSPDTITFLQADATALPLRSESVGTVLSMSLFHVIEDLTTCAEELFRVLESEGTLFATSLVTERAVGRHYLRLLHKIGEMATPRAQDELRKCLESALDQSIDLRPEGNMAFLKSKKDPHLHKGGVVRKKVK
jgi:ubiquinone/menaquinone biosynthesis C-methylase UbiE